jgi:hypothetical protein
LNDELIDDVSEAGEFSWAMWIEWGGDNNGNYRAANKSGERATTTDEGFNDRNIIEDH